MRANLGYHTHTLRLCRLCLSSSMLLPVTDRKCRCRRREEIYRLSALAGGSTFSEACVEAVSCQRSSHTTLLRDSGDRSFFVLYAVLPFGFVLPKRLLGPMRTHASIFFRMSFSGGHVPLDDLFKSRFCNGFRMGRNRTCSRSAVTLAHQPTMAASMLSVASMVERRLRQLRYMIQSSENGRMTPTCPPGGGGCP